MNFLFFGPPHALFKGWGRNHGVNRTFKNWLSICGLKEIVNTTEVSAFVLPFLYETEGKRENDIFTVSLSYTPNNTAPLLGGSISAEVGVWQSKLQPKDMSYSSSAARQWHPRLAPADRAASHRGAVRCSPLPPAISFWQALSSVSLGCLYCIDQAFFFPLQYIECYWSGFALCANSCASRTALQTWQGWTVSNRFERNKYTQHLIFSCLEAPQRYTDNIQSGTVAVQYWN